MNASSEPTLAVHLFGGFELAVEGMPVIELGAVKDRWLLALLLIGHGKPMQRDLLAVTLWPFPDFDSSRAAANLRRGLWTLRHTLASQVWRLKYPTPDTVSFDITDAWVDLIEFDRAIANGDHASLERAISLHRAPLLQTCLEDWVEPERERRQEQRRQARQSIHVGTSDRKDTDASSLSDIWRGTASKEAVPRTVAEPDPASEEDQKETTASDCFESDGQWPEPEGGAVPLDSTFYIVRPTDEAFETAISRRDSIVLVKGAREIGKTSLLARGIQQARQLGAQVVLTDFQTLTTEQMASADVLFLTLAGMIADQLQLDTIPEEIWNSKRGWNINFEKFLRREVLGRRETPLIWAMDEVDRLFGHPFSGEAFGLFRSWHNQRALNPTGPWGRFTLAIAYATEAHLFITDLNQSPFNVGTRLTLKDFTLNQVAELNRRYGAPLRTNLDLERFYALVGGHPALVRRGLQVMAVQRLDIAAVEAEAEREDGLFANHLRQMLHALQQDPVLCEAILHLLQGQPLPRDESFYRLRSAGLIVGRSAEEAQPRCQLYRRYLERHLG